MRTISAATEASTAVQRANAPIASAMGATLAGIDLALQFQCRYRWSLGRVVVWNIRVTRQALAEHGERRIMQRITNKGDRPF